MLWKTPKSIDLTYASQQSKIWFMGERVFAQVDAKQQENRKGQIYKEIDRWIFIYEDNFPPKEIVGLPFLNALLKWHRGELPQKIQAIFDKILPDSLHEKMSMRTPDMELTLVPMSGSEYVGKELSGE